MPWLVDVLPAVMRTTAFFSLSLCLSQIAPPHHLPRSSEDIFLRAKVAKQKDKFLRVRFAEKK